MLECKVSKENRMVRWIISNRIKSIYNKTQKRTWSFLLHLILVKNHALVNQIYSYNLAWNAINGEWHCIIIRVHSLNAGLVKLNYKVAMNIKEYTHTATQLYMSTFLTDIYAYIQRLWVGYMREHVNASIQQQDKQRQQHLI